MFGLSWYWTILLIVALLALIFFLVLLSRLSVAIKTKEQFDRSARRLRAQQRDVAKGLAGITKMLNELTEPKEK